MYQSNHKTRISRDNLRAAIDCGSNSFRLLIAEKTPAGPVEVSRELIMVRLGEGLTTDGGVITPAAERRAIAALKCFQEIIAGYGIPAHHIYCTGTSALRSAVNGTAFVKLVAQRLGLDIHIISGRQEAWLSFSGATLDEPRMTSGLAVLDIGGGSTELVVYNQQNLQSFSVPLGAVRLTNAFVLHDPPLPAELLAIRQHVQQAWKKISLDVKLNRCIGVAGTITNLAAIYHRMSVYQPDIVHGTVLTIHDVNYILKKLCSLDLAQRRRLVGLQPERADIIIAGAELLMTTMQCFGLDRITVSEKDSLHALAYYGVPEKLNATH